ncbi:MAG TPA: Mrp/NBP35 family ATP-binding protein [Chloroflexota bacterium]|nr:Mrp/NBP35 family ATP-binding protein [Chloroflexota bacterium]
MPDPPGLRQVGSVVAVASGKGGVGKSFVATNLAAGLALTGARVGLLDADIYGPTVPHLMGVRRRPEVTQLPTGEYALLPLAAHGIKLMSAGLLPPLVDQPSRPVMLRGPQISHTIKTLLSTEWGELDYLLVDMPPGTGDATLTIAQVITLCGVIIISQPQALSLAIAIKALNAFQKLNVPVLGLIENMSHFRCHVCGVRHPVFSRGSAREAAAQRGVPFLGEIPLSAEVCQSGDAGVPLVCWRPHSPPAVAMRQLATAVAARVTEAHARRRRVIPLRPVED